MPNGSVIANDMPVTRLSQAAKAVENDSPSLKEVISFIGNGSPPGNHYPPGWGLVYFCNNYQNEKGDRVFQPLYEKFLKSYQKKAPKEEPAELFEKIFVSGCKEVDSLDHFKNTWRNWLIQLANRRFGGPDKVSEWLELSEKHAADRDYAAALESCRFAMAHDGFDEGAVAE